MLRPRPYWETTYKDDDFVEEELNDIYDLNVLETIEDCSLTDKELGFMIGYLAS